jgi:magnesium chelatase family protein
VEVERSFLRALPAFSIVGLAGSSIQEARERVKAALLACGYTFPPKKITINLSPSDLKKSGSHFDLAIALAIALSDEEIDEELYIFGELGLDGSLKDTASIFPIVLGLAKKPVKVLAPTESIPKLSKIPGITLYGVSHLKEALDFFKERPEPVSTRPIEAERVGEGYVVREYPLDFAEVLGQPFAVRAALIAAAGWHNILFEGSPGCGKSMIAKRMRFVLPPMRLGEILEVAKMEALEGKEPAFTPLRPFRAPHHSATKASIFGGGSGEAKPGEVAYANKGILFFDELPHFAKGVLEALREPLQEHRLLISRVSQKVEYEADFLFVAAQNPCPCGYLLSEAKECRCTEQEIARYRGKISGPLMDRIELYVAMSEPDMEAGPSAESAELHQMVIDAWERQLRRQGKPNGRLAEGEVERHCTLDPEAESLLQQAAGRYGLSLRSVANIKKVARTIADLAASERIAKEHLLEALAYRRQD